MLFFHCKYTSVLVLRTGQKCTSRLEVIEFGVLRSFGETNQLTVCLNFQFKFCFLDPVVFFCKGGVRASEANDFARYTEPSVVSIDLFSLSFCLFSYSGV